METERKRQALGLLRAMAFGAALAVALRAQAPVLQVQGQPYSGGDITLHITADPGSLATFAYGLDPLDPPLLTTKGAYHIGSLVFVLPLGGVPASGRIDVPISMPILPPNLAGIPLVGQAYVPGHLSNPITVPLDQPHLLPSEALVIDPPLPTQGANFGHALAAGDFNDDGHQDIAVSAWSESVDGVEKAGRVYVQWGPDFGAFTVLEPETPATWGVFGAHLVVADFTGDGIDDLAVADGCGGDPPTPGLHGRVTVFCGGPSFSTTSCFAMTSNGTGLEGYVFGQFMVAGDVSGDGWPDLIVGLPQATESGHAWAGHLEVFLGPDYGAPQIVTAPPPIAPEAFGRGLSLADIDGDGVLDIAVAGDGATVAGKAQAGRLHVVDGPSLAVVTTIDNPDPGLLERFGEGLLAADLDGDGQAELVVSDVKNHFYIVLDPLGTPQITQWPKPPSPNATSSNDTSFGYFLAAADMNLDGLPDIVISDPFEGDAMGCAFTNGGAVYVALAPYYSTFYRVPSPVPACGDEFGWGMIVHDIDGDGHRDILSGAETADVNGVANTGRVILVWP